MRVDGNLVDLQRELHDGAEVEPVEATSEDGSTSSGTRLPTSWLRPSSSCTPR
ncbi:threonyl-tRNA synthetase [Cutibacterium acnes JCM 18918]|nr:threonyl-tRNA synthetase [Cutibacterium acnes JCM 18918]